MTQRVDKGAMACDTPRRTPGHPEKSHIVKACFDGQEKIIRFGEQGAKTAGKPKAGESQAMKSKRERFKSRHGKNIAKGKSSAAYWANKVKWSDGGAVNMAQGGSPALALLEQMRRNANRQPQEFDPVAATLASQSRTTGRQPLPLPPMPPVVAPPEPTGTAVEADTVPQVFPGETAQDARPYQPVNYNRDNPYVAEATRLSEKYNLPPNIFLSLIRRESGYNPTRVSPRGAYGLAQLMPGTAKELGVDIRDPYQNMEGGARYLRQMLDRFGGDMKLALAAYNAGPTKVRRAGNTVPEIRETRDYIQNIMRDAGITNYAHGGLAALDQKYAEGGTVRAPKETTISGQEHELAYITPEEAALLMARGGSGRMTRYGVRAYDEGPGGEGPGGEGPGGDPGDNAGSMSDPSTQDAAGGNAGQGAGPTGAGAGPTGEQGPGPTGEDTGGGETSVTAPETAPAPNTGAFGQFGASLGFGAIGGLAGLGLGVPGLGTVGTAIGTAVDAARANEQLGMMGLDPNISTTQAIANAVSFGMLGQSVTDQFGQALGFDALAEAPMSAFSGPPSDPGPTADTSGGSDYIAQPAGASTLQPALAGLNQSYSEQLAPAYKAWDWAQIQRDAAANNMTLDAYVARNLGNLSANAPRVMKNGGLATLEQKYAEGGAVTIYNPDAVNALVNQIEAQYV